MNIINSKKNMFILILVIVIISLPLLYNGIVQGHDLRFHLSRIIGLSNNIKNGDFMAYIHNGYINDYGYANGLFYCNLFFYFPALLNYIGISVINSYKLFLVLCNLLTVISMYFCMKKMTNDKKISLISAVLYLINPYRICDMFVRAAIGEVLAFIFLPFVILGMYSIIKNNGKEWYYFCIGFSGLIFSHLLTTIIVFVFSLIFVLINIKQILKKETLINIIKAIVLCILITSFYTFPMLEQLIVSDFIVNTKTIASDLSSYTIPIEQIFSGIPHWYNNIFIPSGIGFITIYIMLLRRKMQKFPYQKVCDICLTIGIIAALCTTDIIPWNSLKILAMIQYPWRFYIVSSICLTIGCAIILGNYSNKYLIIIFCLAMICPVYTIYSQYKNEYIWTNYNDYNIGGKEYLPSGTDYDLLLKRGDVINSNRNIDINYERDNNKLVIEYSNNTYNDTYIELPLLYYKGYVTSNDLIVAPGENNVVRIYLDNKDVDKFNVFYKGTSIAIFSKYLTLFTIIGILSIIIFKKFKLIK